MKKKYDDVKLIIQTNNNTAAAVKCRRKSIGHVNVQINRIIL